MDLKDNKKGEQMAALVGEVVCGCGATILRQDGHCNQNSRDQIICSVCGSSYDKPMVMKTQNEMACIVMKRCPEGCEAKMIKANDEMGNKPVMKCPKCGCEQDFDWPKK